VNAREGGEGGDGPKVGCLGRAAAATLVAGAAFALATGRLGASGAIVVATLLGNRGRWWFTQ
jgi:hypothetical protein